MATPLPATLNSWNCPGHTTDTANVNGRRIDISTYIDCLANGRVRIVVQSFVKGLWRTLGIHCVAARGFIATRDGSIEELAGRDLWDFL